MKIHKPPEPPVDRLSIDHGESGALPPRSYDPQQAPGYIWYSTTQELRRPSRSRKKHAGRRCSHAQMERGDIEMTDPQTVVANPAPLTGSERVRRARERKRDDIVFLGIEILPTERNALIRMGLKRCAQRQESSAGGLVCVLRKISGSQNHHRRLRR
jgi:hypothetical protein